MNVVMSQFNALSLTQSALPGDGHRSEFALSHAQAAVPSQSLDYHGEYLKESSGGSHGNRDV